MKNTTQHNIPLQNTNLILITAPKGYIMCGLLDTRTAEKLGHAACKVTGVKTPQQALEAEIKECTTHAQKLGIKKGMTGQQALEKLQ